LPMHTARIPLADPTPASITWEHGRATDTCPTGCLLRAKFYSPTISHLAATCSIVYWYDFYYAKNTHFALGFLIFAITAVRPPADTTPAIANAAVDTHAGHMTTFSFLLHF
jgi:hypothetical protein